MGRRTRATVVPYKLITNSQKIIDIMRQMDEVEENENEDVVLNNWKAVTFSEEITFSEGIDNNIYANGFDKIPNDIGRVFVINECEWAAGGGEKYCLFSKNRMALEQFAQDFSIVDFVITENAAVQQTL